MRIAIITSSYPPEVRSSSVLMRELAEGLRDKGHEITVLTSYPTENLTKECERFPVSKKEQGIHVLRVHTGVHPHKKTFFALRGIAQLLLPTLFFHTLKKYISNGIDAVIVYSPPLMLSNVGSLVKKKFGARFLLNVQDIFPQNAIDLGLLKNKMLIAFFERMEKNAYAAADVLITHSQSNSRYLIEHKNVLAEKTATIHNWIDTQPYRSALNTKKYRSLWGLTDAFLILFAGTLGPSQGLENVVRVAEMVQDIPDLRFVFVGDGMEKEKLQRLTAENNLSNILFKPFISQEEYPSLLKEADVGLVSLTSKNKTPAVPGKMTGYMAGSVPIAAFLQKESDGHEIIRTAQCGYSCVSDDLDAMTSLIRTMSAQREYLPEMGKHGLAFARAHLEKEACIQVFELLLEKKSTTN